MLTLACNPDARRSRFDFLEDFLGLALRLLLADVFVDQNLPILAPLDFSGAHLASLGYGLGGFVGPLRRSDLLKLVGIAKTNVNVILF